MLAFALTACGTREGWVRQGMTEKDLKVDLYACERDRLMAEAGPGFFRRCMESKGYVQQ